MVLEDTAAQLEKAQTLSVAEATKVYQTILRDSSTEEKHREVALMRLGKLFQQAKYDYYYYYHYIIVLTT